MELRNKVAFINGGARIGAVIAEALAKKGCSVALSYRSSKKAAEETALSLRRWGVSTLTVKGDMSKEPDVKRVLGAIVKKFSRLDVLINMASVYNETPFARLTEKDWTSNMDANLRSAYLTVKNASRYLAKNGGRVVNFADWVAASGRPRYKGFLPYYTAKAGVIGLTQAQALELAPRVLVNAIAPGPILPPTKIKNEEVRNVARVTPLGKWGGPAEIAKAVLFLCDTDFVTGETLRVDGGRHLY